MQARAEIEVMAHLHTINKDINLSPVLLIPEKESLMAMQCIIILVGGITQLREQRLRFAGKLCQHHKIEVFIGAFQLFVRLRAGGLQVDSQSPQQAQGNTFGICRIKHTHRFSGNLFEWPYSVINHAYVRATSLVLSVALSERGEAASPFQLLMIVTFFKLIM